MNEDNVDLKKINNDKYNKQYELMLKTSDDLKILLDKLIEEYQECTNRRKKIEETLDKLITSVPDENDNVINWSVSMSKTIREIRQVLKSLIYKERILLESITELSKSSVTGPKNLGDIVSEQDKQKQNLLHNLILEKKQGDIENMQETVGALTYATIMKIQEDTISSKNNQGE